MPLIILLASLAVGSKVLAQEAPTVTAGSLGTLEDAVREATALTDEERAPLLLDLQQAAQDLARAKQLRQEADSYRRAMETSTDEVERYNDLVRGMDEAPPSVEDRLGSDPDLEDIEAELDIVEARRRSLAEQRTTALAALGDRSSGDSDPQQRLAAVTAELEALQAPPAADGSLNARVSAAAQTAEQQRLEAEAEMLKLRLRATPAINAIRTAKLAWLDASLARADALLGALREAAATTRESAAARRIEETRRIAGEVDNSHPDVLALAEENISLIRDQQRLADALADARNDTAALRDLSEYIEEDYRLTQRRLEVAGLEGKLGQVMMTRLASLPDKRDIQRGTAVRNEQLADVSVNTIDTDEALRQSTRRSAYLRERFPNFEDWTRVERRVLDRLYEQRRDLLREKLEAQNALLRLLVDTNQAAAGLIEATEAYEAFLTGNLLWIRSYRFLDPAELVAQLWSLLDPAPFLSVASHWQQQLRNPATLLGLVLIALLLVNRRRILAAQQALLGVPIRPREESPRKIASGVALGVARSALLPGFLLLTAWVLASAGGDSLATEGIARGLGTAGALIFGLQLAMSVTARVGTGRRLLKWNNQKTDAVRRDLPWLSIVLPIAAGLSAFARTGWGEKSGGALAALATFTVSLAGLIYSVRLLRSGQFSGDTLGKFFLRAAALLSGAAAFMHLSGQLFAAHLYLTALGWSVAAVALTLFVMNVLQRIILIYRSRLERRQREELRAQAEAEAASDTDSERDNQLSERDIDAVASLSDAQGRLLGALRLAALATLLWFIWSPALPAITLLEDVTLWSTADPTLPEGELRPVSLATLIIAALVVTLTTLLTRHVPPLVQVLLMEYASVSAGARYAIGMLLQYVIIGVGASVSLGLIGFAWSKVQWLVAALGVGIGFGLQEIVANFISGIILLFERPIRVGDVISVSGYDGTVVNISARATVIETFEGKELLIPNKDLITGVVNNWSLTSSKLRIVIPVGVAYGSDVRKAMRILVEVARDHPAIIDDPAPVATFEDFGDNALTLWLRCYAESEFIHRWTELRTDIYERLNKAGIGIAFPQRDVHLDAAEPIPVQLVERPVVEKN
ncbi:Potassium efflux system KefA protein / Small-conductance mechanosensitive channel [Pseudohaliea rubra DSM 19751]|uniref:Potassium efflux system KefA protein / Small-conductance mechanosensitive channel n=1 Tax=Pseudohaliea rubra DSM 19751 TaxID=1265313 RepID=A0A095VN28_9GAMM|nr:Potassium efflux system KefA protein / Small-conductance mechanosensitive channel [Pseudohaliea rubra DSM 19751]